MHKVSCESTRVEMRFLQACASCTCCAVSVILWEYRPSTLRSIYHKHTCQHMCR